MLNLSCLSYEEGILALFFPLLLMMSFDIVPMLGFAMLGNIFLLSGIVLLLAWAIKNLHKEKLRQVAVWSIVAGSLLWLLSGVLSASFGGFGNNMRGPENVQWMMGTK